MKIAAGGLAKDGVDPAAAKIPDRAARTIGDLAHEYLTKHAKIKKSWGAGDGWQLTKAVLPGGRHVPMPQTPRAEVVALRAPFAAPAGRNAPSSAVHVRR